MEGASHINFAMTEDIITNGTPKFITAMDEGKQPLGSVVSFHNIHYKVQCRSGFFCKRKTSPREILVNLNGIMGPGLNAILGTTGSGKSSLMDILAARKDPSGLSGEVLIDKVPQPPNFKWLSGYVVQDDVFMGTLTVRENLRFSAALRLPSSVPESEKEARVWRLIKELGLTKVADSRVGTDFTRGISGGERKRMTIGMELIIDPSVLFLDEPTTGLDSSTAHSVLLLIKKMANHGRTIIMSIHQPRFSIYRLFDSLTLLVNGRMLYHGPAPNALDYFASIGYICDPYNNPADFFLDVINGHSINTSQTEMYKDLDSEEVISTKQRIEERLVEEYNNSSYCSRTRAELDRIANDKKCFSYSPSRACTYNCSFFRQLRLVLKRNFQNDMLNPQTSVAQLGVGILLALMVGAVFFGVTNDQSGIQNRTGAFFFIVTQLCFTTISAAELFIIGRTLFVHEYISGYYRISVFFLAKIVTEIAVRTVISVVFCIIVYFMIGLKYTAAAFFYFTLTVTQVTYTATALSLAIAADKTVVALATIYMTISFVIMMLFSGLIVDISSIMGWLAWLKYLSVPRYGFDALNINEFVGLKFCEEAVIQNTEAFATMTNSTAGLTCTGEQHLDYLGLKYTTWGHWENNVALAVMMIISFAIAYLKLRYVKKFT
ncbi:broad substrate specificity ATP-binding cassette transporter ABCG2-like [Brachionichthys hirsutus]|uniref:broad substrate specificity ATP-binding cassette transporter ABCG2-like n=1 Tax=Brachionichthys hirsutus TaxID=412623 RepID=UPI0036048DCF